MVEVEAMYRWETFRGASTRLARDSGLPRGEGPERAEERDDAGSGRQRGRHGGA